MSQPEEQMPPPAGQRVNLALAASLLGGIRPASITVELTQDGRPSALIIDAPWGTQVKDTRRVFEALGIREPALVEWPEPGGRTRVDVDDGDPVRDPFGRLGIPVSITVDGPAAQAETGDATGDGATDADVIDLAGYRATHPAATTEDDEGWEL